MSKPTVGKLSALALASVAFTAFAYDSDTLAFYPFKDGAAGASAVGTPILNAVDGTKHAGTAAVKDNGTSLGKVEFSDDIPAKYIFAGMSGAPIATNVQSLVFDGTMDSGNASKEGGSVSFDSLGTAVSAEDDYTVEFFWKLNDSEDCYYRKKYIYTASLVIPDGSYTTKGNAGAAACVNLPEGALQSRVWMSGTGNDVNTTTFSALYKTYGTKTPYDTLMDGKWHHIAVTHSKSDYKTKAYFDYTSEIESGSKSCLATNETLTTAQAIVLGNYVYRGKVACLRVTKKVLTTGQMLHASNNVHFYTDKEGGEDLVFHWGCEGANGADVSTVTNRYMPTQNFHQANPELFYFNDNWIVPTTTLYSGNGRNSTDWPTTPGVVAYTNGIPDARKTNVTQGNDRDNVIGPNLGSIALHPLACGGSMYANGLTIPTANFRHVQKGKSLTCECFFKFDPVAAAAAGAQANYPWFTIMGAPTDGWTKDWRVGFDFSPRVSGQTTGQVSQWQYLRPQMDMYWVAADGTSKAEQNISAGSTYKEYGQSPFDNEWHHCAFVYDETTSNVTAYLDYKVWMTKNLPGPLNVRDVNKQTYVFGCGCSGYAGPFTYDEIRLTRRALKPEEFLYLNKPRRGLGIFVR